MPRFDGALGHLRRGRHYPLQKEVDRECGPFARRAHDADFAAHGARELHRDGEPQPRPAVAPAYGGVRLLELGEQPLHVVGRKADAGVLHRDLDAHVARIRLELSPSR